MAKRILDNLEYQARILANIEKTGVEKDSWQGICGHDAFYNYLSSHSEFADKVTQAKDRFRKLQWRDRTDLKERAVAGLEKALIGNEQSWVKQIYTVDDDGNEKLVTKTFTKTKQPPSKWAIEALLGIEKKIMDDDNINKDYYKEILNELGEKIKQRDEQ